MEYWINADVTVWKVEMKEKDYKIIPSSGDEWFIELFTFVAVPIVPSKEPQINKT